MHLFAMNKIIFIIQLRACLFALPGLISRFLSVFIGIDICCAHCRRLVPPVRWLLVICVCFPSISYASSPSTNDEFFCLPLDYEDRRASDSLYAATKQALDLDVGKPRTVRMIYFLPNDRPFRQEVVDSMKVTIRQIQTFYAEQMQAHGHGNKTFHFEIDTQGDPMIHRVDGQYPDSHYLDNTLTVLDEIEQAFDRDANIYLIIVDNSINAIGSRGQRVGGIGGDRGKNGGFALVHGGFSFHTAAHELGHAFGLQHDFRDDNYIMSYGPGWDRLSVCSAEFLAVHPYFNPSVEAQEAPPPTIEITSPLGYPAGSRSVSIQLKVSDTDDLHQVILFVGTREPHLAAGSLEIKSCRGLSGERDTIIEFDYDGVIPSADFTRLWNLDVHPISIQAVDTEGNVRTEAFSLWEISPHRIATLEHSPYSPAGAIPTIESVAYSPDGTMLVSGAGDGTVKLWDMAKKENIATFEGHTDRGVSSVAFSPGGTTLASGGGDGIKLWDVSTRRNIATLEEQEVSSVTFSPDGTMLASGSSSRIVKLWDISTRRNIATFEGHTGTVHSVAFSSDGITLASGSSDGTVKLWDVEKKENIATFEGHKSWVSSVAYSPNGTTLASGGGENKTVKLWDIATRQNIATFEGHTGTVHSVTFSSDGTTLASGSGDGTVKLWDIATRQNIATYKHIDKHSGYAPFVYSVAFSPDGTTLASGAGAWYSGGTIILWDVSEWIRPRPQSLVKISGDNQQGTPSMELANPFVVEVKDQHDNPLSDVQVTFTVTKGDGKLRERFTVENTMTDANGRAQSIITLGPNPGTNTIEVTIPGFEPVTFNAVGVGTPTIMGGDYRKWHLPDGAIIRLGKGHLGGSDRAVAFSPDGQRLAVAGGIGVWLYDAATLRELALFTGHTGSITSAAFSPDGTMLASGSSDKTVKLWDIATGRTIATLEGHTGWITSVAFSFDGTTLASVSGQQVKLWDVATKQHIAALMHTHSVYSVVFSSDGTTLVSGSWSGNIPADAGTIWLWDVSTRRHIATLEEHTGAVTSVDFSSNVSTLTSGSYDGTVKLWDLATQTNIATLEGHTGVVYSVAFSSDGMTLASGAADYTSGSYDGTVKLWDLATQTNIATLEGHTDIIRSVAFSPDGTTLVSGGEDGVRVWDVLTQNISNLEGHSRNVFFSSFSSDGTMLAGRVDGMFKLWDVNTGHPVAAFEGHTDEIRYVAFSSDGITLASTSYDNTIKLWDIATGRTIATLEGRTEHIHSVTFSPDGTILASWGDQGVEIWDVAMGGTIATLKRDTSWISSMVFSPDGMLLAAGSDDRMVKLWNISTGRNIVTLEGHGGKVLSVEVSPDRTILASREQNEVKLWDISTGHNITTLEWPPWLHVNSVVFSPDGTMLASGDNSGWIELWEVSTGRNISSLEGHTKAVGFVAFSPDGTILASGGYFNDEVKLWDVATKRTIATLEHFEVTSIMFSPDGMRLASRSSDGTVLLWDISSYITPQTPDPDFNGDGRVDLSDFLLFASQFGLSHGDEQYDAKYDLDGDGTIGFGDFLIFGRSFGKEGS